MNTNIQRKCFKLSILISLQFFYVNVLMSCSCGFTPDSFCESISNEHLLVLATTATYKAPNSMYFRVIEGINNDLAGDTILILGHDGANCLESIFFPVDTVLLAIKGDSIAPLEACGIFHGIYYHDTLLNTIYPDQRGIAYTDFLQNIQPCLDMPPYFPGIGKLVHWRDTSQRVKNFPFMLDQFSLNTDENGNYNFQNIPFHQELSGLVDDFLLQPKSDFTALEGVNTSDLVAIQKHVLGIESFIYPEQYIAADINYSKSISVLDVLLLRRLLLNIDASFPNQESWRFIPLDYTFPSPDQPLQEGFPESISISFVLDLINFEEYIYRKEKLDFRVIKMGDVI